MIKMHIKFLKKTLKWIILILIIFFSIFITINIKEKYPSLALDYKTTNSEFIESLNNTEPISYITKHAICNFYPITIFPDETRINEGDPMIITVEWKAENKNQFLLLGFNEDKAESIPSGKRNKMEITYYKKGKNKIYIHSCYINKEGLDLANRINSGSFEYQLGVERPSFVDSWIGGILVFLTTFIVLGEIFKLLTYFLK